MSFPVSPPDPHSLVSNTSLLFSNYSLPIGLYRALVLLHELDRLEDFGYDDLCLHALRFQFCVTEQRADLVRTIFNALCELVNGVFPIVETFET